MNPVSLGLIGPGFHARTVHLPALALAPRLRLAAVASSKLSSTDEAAAHFRAKGYVGYEALLEQADVEAVLISAPAATHGFRKRDSSELCERRSRNSELSRFLRPKIISAA